MGICCFNTDSLNSFDKELFKMEMLKINDHHFDFIPNFEDLSKNLSEISKKKDWKIKKKKIKEIRKEILLNIDFLERAYKDNYLLQNHNIYEFLEQKFEIKNPQNKYTKISNNKRKFIIEIQRAMISNEDEISKKGLIKPFIIVNLNYFKNNEAIKKHFKTIFAKNYRNPSWFEVFEFEYNLEDDDSEILDNFDISLNYFIKDENNEKIIEFADKKIKFNINEIGNQLINEKIVNFKDFSKKITLGKVLIRYQHVFDYRKLIICLIEILDLKIKIIKWMSDKIKKSNGKTNNVIDSIEISEEKFSFENEYFLK